MIFWPFLFVSLLWAAGQSVEEYCFTTPAKAGAAVARLSAIAVPTDKISKDGSCVTVTTGSHRRELMQRYLRSVDTDFTIRFSNAEMRTQPCLLKVEKIKSLEAEQGRIGLTRLQGESARGQQIETFQIQTLKDFELTVDQDSIQGECAYLSQDRYEITIKVRKEAKPLIPPVPPGTIVVVQTPPPDQETMTLQTQLQLERGNKVEMGSVVRQLKEDAKAADLAPRVELRAKKNIITEKVFLSLN